MCIPEKVLVWAAPHAQAMNTYREVRSNSKFFDPMFEMLTAAQMVTKHIEEIKKEDPLKIDLDGERIGSRPTLLRYLIHGTELPEVDKGTHRLASETQILFEAASLTTGRTASMCIFYLLKYPQMRARVQGEVSGLMAAWPEEAPTFAELEKLNFLQAVIKEALRCVLS